MNSRMSRIEEKKTKRQLYIVTGLIVVIIIASVTVGIPLVVNLGSIGANNKKPIDASDKTAPVRPVLVPVAVATNSANLKVEGYAEPDTTLKLFLNGEVTKKVLLASDGNFSFSDIRLDSGQNSIYATSTDASGNESELSETLEVLFKKTGPKLEVSEPQNGQQFSGNQQQISIKGVTDKGTRISINDRFVSVSNDATFNYSLKLNDGENTLKIRAVDPAGNETNSEIKVTYSP